MLEGHVMEARNDGEMLVTIIFKFWKSNYATNRNYPDYLFMDFQKDTVVAQK